MSRIAVAFLALLACVSLSRAQNQDFTYGTTRVRFLGKSPNFQIYPNTSQPAYLQIRFAKLQELDSTGTAVKGHVITSLASADPVWAQGTTVIDNVTVTYVSLSLNPTTQNNFDMTCGSTGGSTSGTTLNVSVSTGKSGNRRMLYSYSDVEPQVVLPRAMTGARSLLQAGAPEFRIMVFFGNNASVNFPYGKDKNMTLGANGLKFNVDYSNWPFCADANTLNVDMNLMLMGDAQATAQVSTVEGAKRLNITLGNNISSLIDFADYGYKGGVNGTEKQSVGVNINQNDGGKTTVTLALPNPTPNNTFYYDPTVTSTYNSGGAAGAARTTVWALLGAALLSVFMGTARL